ncbi:MAG: Gfo/Idh/MocA family oxidoreductase [Defluviitaleaceae bacterium]|nr:Gfo/Idh/MocA family oxidoreductase [Defluviitaleaceae bacterium]
MKKEIRVALIGTGVIAHGHAQEYQDIPGVKIVAACDLLPAKLEAFCDKYGIENRYADYREMLARDDLDAVDVCVHNNLHRPLTEKVLESGRHCYCEKPMAGSWADAKAMLDKANELDKHLHIQIASLYTPQAHAAERFIREGQLGKIYHARSYGFRRRGRPFVDGYAEKEFDSKYWAAGGALYDMGVYHISLLLYLLGNPKIERVSGAVYQEMDMDPERRAESGFDVEELGCGFVKFGGGLTMDILESWAIHGREFPPSVLAGSKGGLSIWNEGRKDGSPLEYYTELSGSPITADVDPGFEQYRTRQAHPELAVYDRSQARWIAALRGEAEWPKTAEIALNTMLISEGIYRSSAEGREFTAEEIIAGSKSSMIRRQETSFGELVY